MSTGEILVAADNLKATEIFSDRSKLDGVIESVRVAVSGHVPDTTTAKGRSAITSLAYKVTRSKTLIDDMGKEIVAEMKRQVAAVDSERRYLRDELDTIRDAVRKPLDEWELEDQKRKNAIRDRIADLQKFAYMPGDTVEKIDEKMGEVVMLRASEIGNWQEFEREAHAVIDTICSSLDAAREIAEQARLQAERLQRDREELARERAAVAQERKRLQDLPQIRPEPEPQKAQPKPVPVTVEEDADELFGEEPATDGQFAGVRATTVLWRGFEGEGSVVIEKALCRAVAEYVQYLENIAAKIGAFSS